MLKVDRKSISVKQQRINTAVRYIRQAAHEYTMPGRMPDALRAIAWAGESIGAIRSESYDAANTLRIALEDVVSDLGNQRDPTGALGRALALLDE